MCRDAEVTCQMSEGRIIPLRFRVTDEDGIRRAYCIKAYKEPKIYRKAEEGYFTVPRCTPDILDYECKIEVFGTVKIIVLRYFRQELSWKILL